MAHAYFTTNRKEIMITHNNLVTEGFQWVRRYRQAHRSQQESITVFTKRSTQNPKLPSHPSAKSLTASLQTTSKTKSGPRSNPRRALSTHRVSAGYSLSLIEVRQFYFAVKARSESTRTRHFPTNSQTHLARKWIRSFTSFALTSLRFSKLPQSERLRVIRMEIQMTNYAAFRQAIKDGSKPILTQEQFARYYTARVFDNWDVASAMEYALGEFNFKFYDRQGIDIPFYVKLDTQEVN